MSLPEDGAGLVRLRHRRFRYPIRHLYRAGEYEALFDLLEKPGFLARQAEVCGGFQQASIDIEQHALPAAITAWEWDRFLHYALLAINLRGLAEAMAAEPVLRALVRGGRFDLAEDTVAQLPDPARRAAALAGLAAWQRGGERYPELLRRVHEALEPWSFPGIDLPLDALCSVTRHLAPDLVPFWTVWIERLGEDRKAVHRLAWAVAEGYLAQERVEDPGLWQALARVEPDVLVSELPERLGGTDLADHRRVLERLRALLGYEEYPRALLRLLARFAGRYPKNARSLWEEQGVPASWTAELVESGWDLLRYLPPERLDTLANDAGDPGTCAAFRVLALAAAPDNTRTAAALEAVSALPGGPARLHWALRYLQVRPRDGQSERQLGAVLAYLRELRYDADPGDIARFLDLASRFLSRKGLAFEVEEAVFSPASRPETLKTLAGSAEAEPVLEELLEHAERYATAVSSTQAEGFVLRGDLIRGIARRLSLRRRDLVYLERAAERLLPEEEDDLRAALAADFAQRGETGLARQTARGIRAPRRQLESLLPLVPTAELAELLGDPGRRYATFASIEAVEGERLALSALLESPGDPRELAQRCLAPLRGGEVYAPALLRLACHALAFEERHHRGRQDRVAAVELVRASLSFASDDRLAAMTPEIAALGARRGAAQAVVEMQEAARRLLALETVAWRLRREALEDLLARLESVLLPGGDRGPRACRRAAEVLRAFLRLPEDLEPVSARDELRRHWDEVLPLFLAALDRLPGPVASLLEKVPRVWPDWERWAAQAALPPEWTSSVRLCLNGRANEGEIHATAVYLLSSRSRARAVELVARLPSGEERDHLCRRLIRYGWLRGPAARSLLGLVEEAEMQLEAEAFLERQREEGAWMASLVALVARREVDPSDPAVGPLVERLWQTDPESAWSGLARAVVAALRGGGRRQGESAVRLWLHAYLSPRPGVEQQGRLESAKRAREALERALVLSPSP